MIDQALINLDERLEAVSKGMKSVQDALEPLTSRTPRPDADEEDERTLLLRKHRALIQEWENVQDETEVLREELKEDKWLTVFRTVSEQADGMMTSLEKAVKRCQVWFRQIMLSRQCSTCGRILYGECTNVYRQKILLSLLHRVRHLVKALL